MLLFQADVAEVRQQLAEIQKDLRVKRLGSRQDHTIRTAVRRCFPCLTAGEEEEERTALLPDQRAGCSNTDYSSTAVPVVAQPQDYTTVCTFLGLLLNLVFITLGFLTYLDGDGQQWILTYNSFKLIYWTPLIALCAVGFAIARQMRSKFRAYSGLELTVVVTSVGDTIYFSLSLIAVIPTLLGTIPISLDPDHSMPLFHYFPTGIAWLVLVGQILNLVQTFLQMTLMFHASRLSPRDRRSLSHRWFRAVLLYLAMCNLSLWIIDSFVEMKNVYLEPVQQFYFGVQNWNIVTHITMPLTLFFRFNSFIIFLEIYLDQ